MWICPKCATEVSTSSQMCKNCGTMKPPDDPPAAVDVEPAESVDRLPPWVDPVDKAPRIDTAERAPGQPPLDWSALAGVEEPPIEAALVDEPPTAAGDEPAGFPGPFVAPIAPDAGPTRSPRRRVAFRVFRGTFATWQDLFEQAADFAGSLGPDRVISISHSEDRRDGVVTVWYWR